MKQHILVHTITDLKSCENACKILRNEGIDRIYVSPAIGEKIHKELVNKTLKDANYLVNLYLMKILNVDIRIR